MLENLYNFLVRLTHSFFTFLKILITSKWVPDRHIAKSKSIVILGNGPSLKETIDQYKKELKSQTLICVNNFPVTDFYEELKPEYYIINSKEFWRSDTKDGIHAVNRQKMISAAIEKTTWKLTFFIPYSSRSNPSFIKAIKRNSNIDLVFYNTTPIEGLPFFNKLFMNLGWGSPRPHNVLIPAILMAINSGFKQIALIGADHSWIPQISVNENNEALVNQQHFYDEATSKKDLMFKDGVQPRRLHEILEKFMFSFRSYFDLKDYAEGRCVKIYNCTPGSYIDAFERKTLSECISDK